MFKDKTVRVTLFGTTTKLEESIHNSRVTTWNFPASGSDGDIERTVKYPTADGFILYLIKRIEKLEELVNKGKK